MVGVLLALSLQRRGLAKLYIAAGGRRREPILSRDRHRQRCACTQAPQAATCVNAGAAYVHWQPSRQPCGPWLHSIVAVEPN
jgi:hypothetical protein